MKNRLDSLNELIQFENLNQRKVMAPDHKVKVEESFIALIVGCVIVHTPAKSSLEERSSHEILIP